MLNIAVMHAGVICNMHACMLTISVEAGGREGKEGRGGEGREVEVYINL